VGCGIVGVIQAKLVDVAIFELGGVVLPDRKNTLELHAGAGALTGALLVTPFGKSVFTNSLRLLLTR